MRPSIQMGSKQTLSSAHSLNPINSFPKIPTFATDINSSVNITTLNTSIPQLEQELRFLKE